VSGTVIDAETGAPIVGASCSLLSQSVGSGHGYVAPTNAGGFFEFSGVVEDTYTFSCSHLGYKLFSVSATFSGSGSSFSFGTIQLEFDYCATTPPCSGHGQCDGVGLCVCADGWDGTSCAESILPTECSTHRGFTEDVLNDVLVMSALNKNLVKLTNLQNNLFILMNQLPLYHSNSCCNGNDGYIYPVEVSSVSTSSFVFLQSLIQFNEDSQVFYDQVKH